MTCQTCNGKLQFGYGPHGERVFCEDCTDGLEAGMKHWASVMSDYAEALALYDAADRLPAYGERCRTEMRDAYDMAKEENDRLEKEYDFRIKCNQQSFDARDERDTQLDAQV